MGTKNRNRRIADFFLLYHYPFRVLFSTYYTKLSFVVVKKYDNTNNKDNISISKKCCPRLSLVVVKKKSRQHWQQRQHFYLIPKVLSKVVPRCRLKNDNTNNKDNISILFQKVLSKVVPRCRQKVTTTKTTFLSYSKNVVQSCPSLSSKKHDNIDNKDNISISKKCCPRLSLVVVK